MIDFGFDGPVMHCQHIADFYLHALRRMQFETVRYEREAAALHWAYVNAARSPAFAAEMFRY